jgi:hypothetical protein
MLHDAISIHGDTKMSDFLIQHVWKSENTENAVKTVKAIAGMAKDGKLPQGFKLKSINAVSGENRAFCTWEAPSRKALADLVAQVRPPTEVTIFELQKMY